MGILLARNRTELRKLADSLFATLEGASVTQTLGFVPTMGALHEGHATLIRKSARENAITVVSIFVNPRQFGANEDLAKYPRTLDEDLDLCEKAGAHLVFAPTVDDIYPHDFRTQVSVSQMDSVLCGAFRPGHFNGVCTVVMLLLNLIRPQRAYFGLKDFQQYSILARMMSDLEHPATIIGVPTVRDSHGLALSSRNRFLDEHALQTSLKIPRALSAAAELYLRGEQRSSELIHEAKKYLTNDLGFELQYCELRDASMLQNVEFQIETDAVLAVAAFVTGADGVKTRLIDNIFLTRDLDHREALLTLIESASRQEDIG